MPSDSNTEGLYEVHASGAIAKQIRNVQRRATREGRGEEVLAAFRKVVKRLQQDPLSFGEPLYRLPALRLKVRGGVIRPVAVHFAVHEDQPKVFIKGVLLLRKSESRSRRINVSC